MVLRFLWIKLYEIVKAIFVSKNWIYNMTFTIHKLFVLSFMILFQVNILHFMTFQITPMKHLNISYTWDELFEKISTSKWHILNLNIFIMLRINIIYWERRIITLGYILVYFLENFHYYISFSFWNLFFLFVSIRIFQSTLNGIWNKIYSEYSSEKVYDNRF